MPNDSIRLAPGTSVHPRNGSPALDDEPAESRNGSAVDPTADAAPAPGDEPRSASDSEEPQAESTADEPLVEEHDPQTAPGDTPHEDAPPPRRALFTVRLDDDLRPTKVIVSPVLDLDVPIPEEQLQLLDAVEAMDRDLDCIFDPKGNGRAPELGLFLRQLKDIAQIGLGDPSPRVGLALTKLEWLKLDVLARQAGPHRIRTLQRLGKYALILSTTGVLVFLVAMASYLGGGEALAQRPILGQIKFMAVACVALLGAGCAAGVWLSFLLRQPPVEYTALTRRDQDLWGPRTKLVAAELLTMVLAIMFHLGVVEVDLGSVATTSVFRTPLTALLIGLLCGISEQVLSERVAPIAARIGGGTGRTPRVETPNAPAAG